MEPFGTREPIRKSVERIKTRKEPSLNPPKMVASKPKGHARSEERMIYG